MTPDTYVAPKQRLWAFVAESIEDFRYIWLPNFIMGLLLKWCTRSKLVAHVRRERDLFIKVHYQENDTDAAVESSIFSSLERTVMAYSLGRPSGSIHAISLARLDRLLQFKALTPLTNDPSEWTDVSSIMGTPCWRNLRQSSCLSYDHGETYYDMDEPSTPELPDASSVDDANDVHDVEAAYEYGTIQHETVKIINLKGPVWPRQ